jgi:hypothetical protein
MAAEARLSAVDPTLAACELRLGLNIEGLHRTAANQQSPIWLPSNGTACLVPV